MRSTFASWAALLLLACSGSEFAQGSSHSGIGGAAGGASDGSGGSLTGGAGGQTGVSGAPEGGMAGRTGTAGHAASGGSSGAPGSGGSRATGGAANGTGGTTSSGTGGGVTVDAGPPPITACGDAPPDPAAKCSGAFACTYGTDPRPGCRVSYRCSGGVFLVGAPKCPVVKSCYTDVSPLPVVGKACDPLGDFCIWDGGLACSCAPCSGTSCTDKNTWDCAPAASTPCPVTAPNEGQPCDDAGPTSCTYGACGVASYVVARCRQKLWTLEIPPCN